MNVTALLLAALVSALGILAGGAPPLGGPDGSSAGSDTATASARTPRADDVIGGNPTGGRARG